MQALLSLQIIMRLFYFSSFEYFPYYLEFTFMFVALQIVFYSI